MMTAREEILERVRRALGPERPETTHGPDPNPPTTWDRDSTVAQFVDTTAEYRAVVEQCAEPELPTRIAAVLSDLSATTVVRPAGLDPSWLALYPGTVTDDDELSADDLDRVSAVVTAAVVGIAATGTIVLDHAPDQGRRAISLVPDVHLCVLRADQVVPDVPQATAALRDTVRAGRPLTWISGPSATSDIELDRVEGVHGPRTLHVIVTS